MFTLIQLDNNFGLFFNLCYFLILNGKMSTIVKA